jgi:hypothetical protein
MADREAIAALAREALAVQDACNLSGVAHGFARAMASLRALGFDTEECNRSAITRLWLDKLNSLAGIQALGDADYVASARAAYTWADSITRQ